ncbi:hypothetical protein K456DRAFT_46265 [Colletotrichum gloeosporioides 23]|nr:hypothetical protein K456DRAFT_46265 [Colletotrichum gloeosporioides 23]
MGWLFLLLCVHPREISPLGDCARHFVIHTAATECMLRRMSLIGGLLLETNPPLAGQTLPRQQRLPPYPSPSRDLVMPALSFSSTWHVTMAFAEGKGRREKQ